MRIFTTLLFLVLTNFLFAQFSEELVEIDYEQDQLISIQIYPDIPYIDQMLGGIVINTDDDLYTFVGQGGDTKMYTADIATGDILYEVDVPQIQMLQFQPGSDELIGLSKGNPSGVVSLATINYKTGAFNPFSSVGALQDLNIDTHNSVIDPENDLFYYIGSLNTSNNWSVIVMDISNGTFVKSFEITPDNQFVAALAFDADRNRLLGLLSVTPGEKSLVEIDPVAETITEIRKIPGLMNTFGGHRYWAYNDAGDEFFVIGLDGNGDSFLFVLNSMDGAILFQHPYEDDAWIMEEHSPLELRYSPNTKQLLGLRKGEMLPPVSTSFVNASANSLKITPNPAKADKINISVKGDEIIQHFSVFSLDGSMVMEQKNINSNTFDLSIQQLPTGVYFLLAYQGNTIYRQSFVVE